MSDAAPPRPASHCRPRHVRWCLFFCLLLVFHVMALAISTPFNPTECPNKPAGRLEENLPISCPVPGKIGIVTGNGYDNVISWAFPPGCTSRMHGNSSAPQLDCIFTSTAFRNGHGISLVTTTTTASHIIGLGALDDKPIPLAARIRNSLGLTYEIVPVRGKGNGVVAKRKIRRGEIIMVDLPALLIGVSLLTDAKPHHRRRLLRQSIKQLPEETRNRVYGLSRGSSEYEMDAILGPNANTVMLAEREVHIGLFTKAARINHSCRPNAYYRFSERRLTMEVVAYHSIDPGEEIVMSYVPLEMPAKSRRRYLQDNWGFECTCSLCRGSETEISESESWRRRIKSLKETILDARSEGFYQDAITMTEEWLMFSEWDTVPPLLPEYHDILADLHFRNGDMINATRYARMAVDGWVRFGSVDDEPLEKARAFLSRLGQLSDKRKQP